MPLAPWHLHSLPSTIDWKCRNCSYDPSTDKEEIGGASSKPTTEAKNEHNNDVLDKGLYDCGRSAYLEEETYEEHQKRIGKFRRLWWKIYWKVNHKSTCLEEGCSTKKILYAYGPRGFFISILTYASYNVVCLTSYSMLHMFIWGSFGSCLTSYIIL
ncbi:transmembrane protein, putative [Medicago truncatula]|uniref:Transmembrane protein, putative n=1 Tax=Medicago truncatula TaxID=3880 RepID=G7KHN9_MEDTR|nr:transmembrane protein, putative [Medicago truncatula]